MRTNIYLIFSIVLMFGYTQVFAQRFIPDTTINSILLLQNTSSSILFCSNLDSSKINHDGEIDFFKEEQPFVLFLNTYKTEYLIAIIHEGTFKYYFSEFEIGKISDSILQKLKIPYIVTQYKDFRTENNLSLGITLDDLEKKRNKLYSQRECNKMFYQ